MKTWGAAVEEHGEQKLTLIFQMVDCLKKIQEARRGKTRRTWDRQSVSVAILSSRISDLKQTGYGKVGKDLTLLALKNRSARESREL